MKTRDIVFYATLAVAALAMAGCEKSNDMPQESGPGHPAEIRFAPAIVPLTRATGTAFEEGDAVGIYCVESTDDPAAAIVGERYIEQQTAHDDSGNAHRNHALFLADGVYGTLRLLRLLPL